ncbi:hypothetical protein KIW84_041876 [Lathyrus oleraceus]|uniref:Homeobox domain-containing protein n=1 Tax=Pisum sativum TaxID=3888 RepID=A0A9D4XAY5_PEA|nr:hypothetical protein KIW84_041876 [Pisum sativum]
MAMAVAQQQRDNSIERHIDSSGKYVRYTAEQIEALEKVYVECSKPSSLRRQQLIRECPVLGNIEPKQIKVWFQNRRCREKQRKEASQLQTVNRKLAAMNKLLTEENERLQKQVSELVNENGFMRQQLQPAVSAAPNADGNGNDSAAATPRSTMRDANSPAGFQSIAEETLTEFLSKATGTAVEWVQMPGMKPGPDSVGIFAISQGCNGVAARACGLVSLEPSKTYSPMTLSTARDFWTLRYTTNLDNGIYALGKLMNVKEDENQLSAIARQGSGSACRSLFGGFVKWIMGKEENGSDSLAVQLADEKHWDELVIVIAVVSSRQKETSSTSGMRETVETSWLESPVSADLWVSVSLCSEWSESDMAAGGGANRGGRQENRVFLVFGGGDTEDDGPVAATDFKEGEETCCGGL